MKRLVLGVAVLSCLLPVSAYAAQPNPELLYYADAYADHYQVSRALVYAIVEQESSWNPSALSKKGAVGLMELMPETARLYGVRNRYVARQNLSGGVQDLADLLRQFHGELRLVVAAYYCGSGPVDRRGLAYGNPDVVAYVEAIRRRYEHHLREQQFRRSSLSAGGQ